MLVISMLIVVGIPRIITNFQTGVSVIFLNCNSLFVIDNFSFLFSYLR